MRKSLLALSLAAAVSTPALAADYTDGNTHKNDYKWMQFNLMHVLNEKPGNNNHTYFEMEFGGRSGIFDLYGYLDVFNLTDDDDSDKSEYKGNNAKMFAKFAPRMSIDGLFNTDLSVGPIKEWYVADYTTIDGNSDGGYATKNGIGADVMVPWFGKVQFNLYKSYNIKNNEWNGYQFSTVWFKPFVNFENGSFIAYQGYLDYEFGLREKAGASSDHGLAWFNGIYWHSNRFAVGYGLKVFDDVYGIKDSKGFSSSGVSHYFDVTYKF
ncbi:MAG: outer membrane protein OmpK [Vibrio sp.]